MCGVSTFCTTTFCRGEWGQTQYVKYLLDPNGSICQGVCGC